MIIPSRWFGGGKGLDDFRDRMLNDNRLKEIHDFLDAADCFPGVEIKGGINYFLWDRDNPGKCKVHTYKGGKVFSVAERNMREDGSNVFIRFNEAIPILHKVRAKKEKTFDDLVSAQKPFGIRTFFQGKDKQFDGAVKVYVRGGHSWTKREELQNTEWIDKNKVLISMAYNAGDDFPHQVLNKPFVAETNTACTETYLVIGPFANKKTCDNVISYIRTKLFRFLVLLKKPSQHASKKVYSFVPMQDFSEPWDDAKLYKKYGLTKDEIEFIDSMVRPMDVNGKED